MQQGFDKSSSLKLAFAVLLIMKWKQELIFALRRHTIFPSLPLSFIPQPPPKPVNHAHITSCKLCFLKVIVLLKLMLLLVIVCLSLLSPFSLNDYHNRRVCKIWFSLVIKKQKIATSSDPSVVCFVFSLALLCNHC